MAPNRHANMSMRDKTRSKEFIKTLSVGQIVWPKGANRPFVISQIITEGQSIIYYKEGAHPCVYPLPEKFFWGLPLKLRLLKYNRKTLDKPRKFK